MAGARVCCRTPPSKEHLVHRSPKSGACPHLEPGTLNGMRSAHTAKRSPLFADHHLSITTMREPWRSVLYVGARQSSRLAVFARALAVRPGPLTGHQATLNGDVKHVMQTARVDGVGFNGHSSPATPHHLACYHRTRRCASASSTSPRTARSRLRRATS